MPFEIKMYACLDFIELSNGCPHRKGLSWKDREMKKVVT